MLQHSFYNSIGTLTMMIYFFFIGNNIIYDINFQTFISFCGWLYAFCFQIFQQFFIYFTKVVYEV